MGRRKIEILPIQHDRNRSVTFLKHAARNHVLHPRRANRVAYDLPLSPPQRKNGLFKKAYELGVLCSVDVAVIIFGHNNKVYEYCSTDPDAMVQRRLHYTGERDVKTPADFGGDKAGGDDDEDGSDDPAPGGSRAPATNGKFPANNKKRTRDDEPSHLDYNTAGHLLHLQQPAPNARNAIPNISSLSRAPAPVSLPLPPYTTLQQHHHSTDALIEREREREREREGALRQLGLQHLLNAGPNANQFPPHSSHPSLVPNLNLASLLQAHPLLGLGVPGLNLGLSSLLGLGGGAPAAAPGGPSQQELLAMLSVNAANVSGSNALYSNPLFSTLFPNHPGLGGDPSGPSTNPGDTKSSGGLGAADIWPSLARPDSGSAPVSSSGGAGGSGSGSGAGDTSWLSFLGNPRGSQPPSDDVDLSSLFPFDTAPNAGGSAGDEPDDLDDRGGKRTKR
ncbi:SRF-type transcription factor (DNA-binding and dimerization domain) [Ceratobasidium sp. AG-Ba]|nr:SRF-type transcription factor (DNA-binding and dimerization domain) [Ceratobasidium sp. AG-Ba]